MKNSMDAPVNAVPSCSVILVIRITTNGRLDIAMRNAVSGASASLERRVTGARPVNKATQSISRRRPPLRRTT